MQRSFNYISILLITLFLLSCSDNSSGPGNTGPISATISGQVQAPDNATPIQGATVYIGEAPANNSGSQNKIMAQLPTQSGGQENCEEPSASYTAYTCTDADGSFEFETEVEAGQDEIELKILKGNFYFTKSVTINTDGTSDVGTLMVSTSNIDIAVITGSYDRMQDVLAKVGFGEIVTDPNAAEYGKLKLGTETFDLYDGDTSLPEDYPDMGMLFEDKDGDGKPDVNNYDIVFINCGASEEYLFPSKEKTHGHAHDQAFHAKSLLAEKEISTINDYVQNGGMLYTTDLAYNYTEQVFPSYIDFMGDPGASAEEAEQIYAAETGLPDITVQAELLDSNLADWLSVVNCESENCINGDQSVTIRGFASNWAVMNGAHNGADTKPWVKGPVEWNNGSGVKPLSISFSLGSGKVIYSSYHTIEHEHSHEFRPQERILQYLVFE
ncbi:hypothetical protein [Fodinibius salsisoli]|uniref:Carboxypeptidase regulatory-like domain-containing protein n=1 Tax=Fodinibius salsisoli TaxID=2820877 RepID=A0ABT3PJ03_9BACT|nr:hypothetical protein [Fodinibius salsisoli]MCW9705728.1 hypothetical protein [Fodinibius salsisoli]